MRKSLIFYSVVLVLSLITNSNYSQIPDFYDEVIETEDLKISNLKSTASSVYASYNGYAFPTKGQLRSLNIIVTIYYDQLDPFGNASNASDTTNSINLNPPDDLQDFMDVYFTTDSNLKGSFSRIYSESSFGSLILLGDYIVVNIKQSYITPTSPGADFEYSVLMNAVIKLINEKGGLQTVYGHNSISDYDKMTPSSVGLVKPLVSDGKIDNIQFLLNNTYKDSLHSFGSVGAGSGYGLVVPDTTIKVGNTYCGYNYGSYQGIGYGNLSKYYKSAVYHEFAHGLFGDNSFHTSGGNHFGNINPNTFMSLQCGYGLMGAAYSGLIGCNGYERWRMDWRHPQNNTYPIAVNNVNADISQSDGAMTFYLRDFVTYGDVIRIKLPYKQTSTASNQYIWLENHQVGNNNKLDFLMWYDWPEVTCRPRGTPGIYSYVQVGRDVLESSNASTVYYSAETDNLKIISAEGNYDIQYIDKVKDCAGFDINRARQKYYLENPLNGINDQVGTALNNRGTSTIDLKSDHTYVQSKMKNEVLQNDLPWLGDNYDAFIDGSIMDISSNPTPGNAITYYCYEYRSSSSIVFTPTAPERNTRKNYLTGLSIKMTKAGINSAGDIYKVEIRWDDYDVKKDIRWTGDIVLKEKLNLLARKTILLNQNYTTNQKNRDAASGQFSITTRFTCETGSEFIMQPNSYVTLENLSSFILGAGSTLKIADSCVLRVKSGCSLILKNSSNLQITGGGKIEIESGAYICIESGANITLTDYNSSINLRPGYISGVNPALGITSNCVTLPASYTVTGDGHINAFDTDVYVQNETFTTNRYIAGRNIYIGSHVTDSKPQGPVIINNGATVIFDSPNKIEIKDSFKVEAGSLYKLKNR